MIQDNLLIGHDLHDVRIGQVPPNYSPPLSSGGIKMKNQRLEKQPNMTTCPKKQVVVADGSGLVDEANEIVLKKSANQKGMKSGYLSLQQMSS
jgi:hypothetical protein